MQSIGIVVPTTPEQEPLLELLAEMTGCKAEVVEQSIWRIQRLQMEGLRISIIRSGPGMVNAGAATEALILGEQPQAIINYGIAGAHTHEALPGDVIIATQVCAPFNGYLKPAGLFNPPLVIRGVTKRRRFISNRSTRRSYHLPLTSPL